ncbi:hypothetical protein ACEV9T_22710, partial [Vibrio parahaemolyticus]
DQNHIIGDHSKKQTFGSLLIFRRDLWMLSRWNTLLSPVVHNALLRCEQRNTDAPAYHLKHKNQRKAKMPRVANHS